MARLDMNEAAIRHEASTAMKALCVGFLEQFAQDYVEKWIGATGDAAKAEGWAILQAVAALKKSPL